MEGMPNNQTAIEAAENNELSFEEQLLLANSVHQAVDERDNFLQKFGGFDTFAEAGQHIGENRAIYNKLEEAIASTKAELDEKVPNKAGLIEQLRNTGNETLARSIEDIFRLPKTKNSLLSLIFKK